MPEPGDVDDPVLAAPMDPDLADARSNRGHELPIARFETVLNQFQLVAHLLADRLGERPHPFQAVTHPFNWLKPFSHWPQYTRTHILCDPARQPPPSGYLFVGRWGIFNRQYGDATDSPRCGSEITIRRVGTSPGPPRPPRAVRLMDNGKTMRVAVLTSGGDAPGMNAAIRAVVRTGVEKGWEMFGVRQGYAGLIAGNFRPMGARDAGEIMQRGGTILGSARCPEFQTDEGRLKALRALNQDSIDALVVIGGNGSQSGAEKLSRLGFKVVGVASTIDNDLVGSDITIGVDTALNIALEAIDRLKVTASSHQRALLVEVMGRNCGYLALMSGIAGGAEAIAIPEVETDPEEIAREILSAYERGKPHAIVVVAEGARYNAEGLVNFFKQNNDRLGFAVRTTVIGHVQRGGAPTFADRMLATRLGAAAVEELAAGRHGVLVGMLKGELSTTPLGEVVAGKKPLDTALLRLAGILAR
jgi:6-phosphofructokinase 1